MSTPRLHIPSRKAQLVPAAPSVPSTLGPRPSTKKASYGHGPYQAAGYSRTRSIIYAPLTDSRKELTHYTRTELARKANYLRKNVGMVRGVCASLVDHAIGGGIYAIPSTPDRAWNALAWDYFTEVCKIADITGRLTLQELQRARTEAKFYFGEMFTLHTESADGLWPQFQAIRSHLCANYDVTEEDGWLDGIRLDSIGRARAYRFQLKGDGNFVTVPAGSVVHSWLPEDTDQHRGVSALAHAINNLHDIMDTLALEKESMKDNAAISRVIYNESGQVEEEPSTHYDAEGNEVDAAGNPLAPGDLEPLPLKAILGAEIPRLRIGEKMESFQSNRPSPAFMGFIEHLGRDITAGTGFPYEFAWNPQAITGPSVRLVLNKVKTAIRKWRNNEIQDTLPFYTYAIAKGIKAGRLPNNPHWYKVEWLADAEDPTIDGARDSAAEINDLKAGLTTFKRYYAARGLWWERELEQKAIEAELIDLLAKKHGISPDRIHQLAPNNTGDQNQKPAAKNQSPEDEAA